MSSALARRAPDGRLLPGQSLNPGGRPKGLASRVRQLTDLDDIVTRMVQIARGEAIKVGGELGHVEVPSLRDMMQAATWLADRGWGLPHQHVTMEVGQAEESFDAAALSIAERHALEQLLAKAAGEQPVLDAEVVETPALEAGEPPPP